MNERIRLIMHCDYAVPGVLPLWPESASAAEINIDALPLSDRLRRDLESWNAAWVDLVQSHAQTDADWAGFDRTGRQLARVVRRELGPDFEVGYFDETRHEVDWSGE